MIHLTKKEFIATVWYHLGALAFGLALIPVCLVEPESALMLIVFTYLMYSHLIFNKSRYTAASRADNLLLNSLPLTRRQIIVGKYAYVLLCAVMYAAFLCLVAALLKAFGLVLMISFPALWLMLTSFGIIYHSVLMPLSYLDTRYGAWAGMLVYFAILFLPRAIGQGNTAPALAALMAKFGGFLNSWLAPLAFVLILTAVGWLSIHISQRIYRKMDF